MAVLNSWQKITRVLPGNLYGDGSAGNATIGSDPNTRATVTGTATQTTSTLGSAILSNGDICILHQTSGTGAGQWEIQKVSSGGGTTSITWTTALQYTYGTGAQCIKFNLNDIVTVNAHSPAAWNGTTGGVEVICGKTSITVSGNLSANGNNGTNGSSNTQPPGGSGIGFNGGAGDGTTGNPNQAIQGGSSTAVGVGSTSANGAAGGGGFTNTSSVAGGGGAGHATVGTVGTADSSNTPGAAGGSQGAVDLTTIFMGAGGGGGAHIDQGVSGGGGAGGGIVILYSNAITLSALINVNGGNGSTLSAGEANGGAGAGGSILIVCDSAILGTNKATSVAGTATSRGGAGSNGRISVHHTGSVTGTTNPTLNDTPEPLLTTVSDSLSANDSLSVELITYNRFISLSEITSSNDVVNLIVPRLPVLLKDDSFVAESVALVINLSTTKYTSESLFPTNYSSEVLTPTDYVPEALIATGWTKEVI